IIDNSSGINHINDPFTDYDGAITIELRGNSSQGQPKKPYRFETVDASGENNNVSLLGMPEENDWVLYAPWSDKTLIRNALTYQLSNEMGWYASRTRHCELYLNGDYKGIYVLMEKIKRDQNRIDISKLDPDGVEGDDLTGGYILKFDWIWTGDNLGWFESDEGSLYNYHYPKPDEIVSEQTDYIQQYINNFENMMMSNAYNEPQGYPFWLNVDSFIDYIMLQELSKNVDAYRLSTYIYKDKHNIDHRLYAGPLWDINHGFGNCDYGYTWLTNNWLLGYQATDDPIAFWWHKLWNDDGFEAAFSERYTELRSTTLSLNHIYSIIDSVANYLGPAIDRNFTRWPTLGTYVWPNYYVFDTYEEEIEYLKSWTADRLQWMDQEMLEVSDVSLFPKEYHLYDAYPNPFNPVTTLWYELPENTMVTITIYDMLGKKVKTLINETQDAGYQSIIWDATNNDGIPVSAGIYLYQIQAAEYSGTKKMVLLK
ncbi:MAG: CotH kinase family protein, partial [Candidatus Neomarinimicrobiota bacterium]|nr:CotH kinase family protein [Candidatus Neomarinimicrobiota bacterium]